MLPLEKMGGGLDKTNAGSYNCCSCRGEGPEVDNVDVGVGVDGCGGDRSGEAAGLEDCEDVEDREVGGLEAGTVKESLRIFMKTEKASSRRAIAWSLDGRKSSEAGTICNTVERREDFDWVARMSARRRTINWPLSSCIPNLPTSVPN